MSSKNVGMSGDYLRPRVVFFDNELTARQTTKHFEEFPGTADYMSPEACLGKVKCSSNVYSWAVVGERLFGNEAHQILDSTDPETVEEEMEARANGKFARKEDLDRLEGRLRERFRDRQNEHDIALLMRFFRTAFKVNPMTRITSRRARNLLRRGAA